MKTLALLLFVGVTATFANDVKWMEILSSQIVEATSDKCESCNIPEVAEKLGLKVLVKAVTKAGLAEALSGPGPLTVFGPTDKAFFKLPKPFVKILMKNTTLLADLLKYHVASGEVLAKDLKNDQLVESLLGKKIRINIYKDGKVITASGRPVVLADQKASNGVIHEVSGVLFPPPGTLVTVVSKCPAFQYLLKAVGIADLATTLSGEGPFTLFAPSDRAFKRIPAKCLAALLKDKKLLTKVLTYHVVPSTAYSAGLSCGDNVKTVEGGTVKITKVFGKIWVNFSRVTYADLTVDNGVMHVINKVLFPKEMNEFCSEAADDYDDSDDDGKDDEIDFTHIFDL